MPHHQSPLRGSYRSATAALLTLLAQLSAAAETKNEKPPAKTELDPLIVSALQVPREASTVTSAVTVLDPEQLTNEGVRSVRDALNESPGVISLSTAGQTGAPASLIIRGTSTRYGQVVVDGMRLSDSNNELGQILAGAQVYDLGRIEILRGPQGAIYGGESIGGVLWMETPYGSGKPHATTMLEGGSFNSINGYGIFQGATRDGSFFLSGGHLETDNDAPHNDFRQDNAALRVEGNINPMWTVGTTFRGRNSEGEDLDTDYSFDGTSEVTSGLATLYAIGRISDCWTARFRGGFYQENFDQNYSYYDYTTGLPVRGGYFSDLRASSLATDHEIKLADNLMLLAGAFGHWDSYNSTGSADQHGTRYGAHSSLEWTALEHLTTTASLRWEDYDTFGDEATWRLGSIYNLASTGTSFRGGIGSSNLTPSYLQLFGSTFTPANSELNPESALGWDIGIEQKWCENHVVELTWFQNRISDQIIYPAFGSAAENVSGDTDTNGLELGLRGGWSDLRVDYRVAWTYLNESLQNVGLPRQAGFATVNWHPTEKALVGMGATYLSSHSWGGTELDGYAVARIYGSYQISDKVKLHARIENAFDENYKLFDGFGSEVSGAGTGLYAGITVDW